MPALKLCESHLKHQGMIIFLVKLNSFLVIFQVLGPKTQKILFARQHLQNNNVQENLPMKICNNVCENSMQTFSRLGK